MTRIVHVSDVHFGPHLVAEVADRLLVWIRDRDPQLVIVSGDFTQRAKPDQYRAARVWLDRLPDVPCVVTPGNHDVPLYRVWERLFQPYRLYRQHIDQRLDYVLQAAGLCVVSLNTSTPYRAVVNGVFRPDQLEFCRQTFREAGDGQLRMVVAHHPLASPPDNVPAKVVHRAAAAAAVFSECRVDLVFSGHLHRGYVTSTAGVSRAMASTWNTWLVHSGTSTSGRGRASEKGRQSCNLVEVAATTIDVQHYVFDSQQRQFLLHKVTRLPRGGAWQLDGNPLDG